MERVASSPLDAPPAHDRSVARAAAVYIRDEPRYIGVEDDETERQDRACDGRLTRDRRDRPAKRGPVRGAGTAVPGAATEKQAPASRVEPLPAYAAALGAGREERACEWSARRRACEW